MLGAIIGDIVGSRWEFNPRRVPEDFDFFAEGCEFTDDTICTVAIYAGLKSNSLVRTFKKICNGYSTSYGANFVRWLKSSSSEPYNSCGNGSAMRVSCVGWLYDALEETRKVAAKTAAITHNHPEGIKAAEAVASAIWLARNKKTKAEIKDYVEKEFGYDLSRDYESVKKVYTYTELAQKSVPESIICFLASSDFDDCVRKAVTLHGDADTMAAIAGSIAEAYYGIPEAEKAIAYEYLDATLEKLVRQFYGEL